MVAKKAALAVSDSYEGNRLGALGHIVDSASEASRVTWVGESSTEDIGANYHSDHAVIHPSPTTVVDFGTFDAQALSRRPAQQFNQGKHWAYKKSKLDPRAVSS